MTRGDESKAAFKPSRALNANQRYMMHLVVNQGQHVFDVRRALAIRAAHEHGRETYASIGKRYDISRERVGQIIQQINDHETRQSICLHICFRTLVKLLPTLCPEWDPETGEWRD